MKITAQVRVAFFGLCALTSLGAADTVAIAAAANLVYALDSLNAEFKRSETSTVVTSTTGASGNLFAQIKNGAPFDVFLSADTEYPRQLAEQGLADRTTLQTFASGRLVLWTTRPDLDVDDVPATIRSPSVKKLALAQPRSAPYGRAAQASLEHLGVWREMQPKIVFGENISQTAQFVETGNADVGFVALSLVLSAKLTPKGRWKEVPAEWYSNVALDHAVVLTLRGATNPAAKRYLHFLASESAKKILREFGYRVSQD